MKGSTIGRRYARALLSIADDADQREAFGAELDKLRETWLDSPALVASFEDPKVGPDARHALVDALAEKLALSPAILKTLKLLADRGRMRHVAEVAESFAGLVEEAGGLIRAEVTTATELPKTFFDQLQAALEEATGSKVSLVTKQDPSLIGGVVTRVGDRVFDGSIKTRLDELKETLRI